MTKFSDLKKGNYIYRLILNDNINYNGNFANFVNKELDVKVEKIKIHQIIYPGLKMTGPYYAMTPHGNQATYGQVEDDKYVNIIYQDNGRLVKLILENNECSHNNTLNLIDSLEGIFFVSKEALDEYVLDYCNKYIHQYEMQIKSLEEKKEKYQKFINVYRS